MVMKKEGREMTTFSCDICGCEVPKIKNLHRVCNVFYCSKCYIQKKKQHRIETINNSKDKDKIIELDRKMKRESNLRTYVKKNGHLPRTYNPKPKGLDIKALPKVKGGKDKAKKFKSYAYMSLEEKQNLFRMLVKRGFTEEEAKERIKKLLQQQKEVREFMKSQNKSEEEISKKQINLMAGLLK